MHNTLQQIIEFGVKACKQHGLLFIGIYQIRNEKLVSEGWDRYIISYNNVSEKEYQFIGIVRADGTTEIKK